MNYKELIMKRIFGLALLLTTLLGTSISYAWVCTYQGPLGANYSQNGAGFGYQSAKDNALAACQQGKANAGPCQFMGCQRN